MWRKGHVAKSFGGNSHSQETYLTFPQPSPLTINHVNTSSNASTVHHSDISFFQAHTVTKALQSKLESEYTVYAHCRGKSTSITALYIELGSVMITDNRCADRRVTLQQLLLIITHSWSLKHACPRLRHEHIELFLFLYVLWVSNDVVWIENFLSYDI